MTIYKVTKVVDGNEFKIGETFTNKNGATITIDSFTKDGRINFLITSKFGKEYRTVTPESLTHLLSFNEYVKDSYICDKTIVTWEQLDAIANRGKVISKSFHSGVRIDTNAEQHEIFEAYVSTNAQLSMDSKELAEFIKELNKALEYIKEIEQKQYYLDEDGQKRPTRMQSVRR